MDATIAFDAGKKGHSPSNRFYNSHQFLTSANAHGVRRAGHYLVVEARSGDRASTQNWVGKLEKLNAVCHLFRLKDFPDQHQSMNYLTYTQGAILAIGNSGMGNACCMKP
jgi:hypothetical protein